MSGRLSFVAISAVFLISASTLYADPNLIAHWELDEGTGSTAGDSSGNGNDGTITDATWLNDPCKGMCLDFDGSGDYVTIGNSASLQSIDGNTAEYTISLWVKTTQSGAAKWSQKAIFDRRLSGGSGENDWVAHIYLNNNDAASFFIRDREGGSDVSLELNDTLAINNNKWHHIAAVRKDIEYVRLYVDGDLRQSGSTTANPSTTEITTIGVRRRNSGLKNGYFDGKIDDVRIYNRALSAEEIQNLHAAPRELHVPSEYPTIQAAINDSNDGDTVIVATGTYTGDGNRDIDFLGKAITVRSTDPEDPCVVAATIIDCNGSPNEPHRGFYFHRAEGPDSVLAGFTVKGGIIEKGAAKGGGILCIGSSPTIEYCTIADNTVIGTDSVIFYPLGALTLPIDPNTPISIGPSDPIIIDINSGFPPALTGNTAAGGGIYIEGGSPYGWIPIDDWIPAPIIDDPGIEYPLGDLMTGDSIIINPAYEVIMPIYNPTSANPTIYKCRIVNNNAIGPSAGQGSLTEPKTTGGGIACGSNGSPVIIDCLISNNTARGGDGTGNEAGGSVYGGGVSCSSSLAAIINSMISNNTAIGGSGGPNAPSDGGNAYGGGIYGSATVINSIISSNIASAGEGGEANGGAVYYLGLLPPTTLINCTISKNTSVDGAAVVCGSNSIITNCILWANIGSPVIDAIEFGGGSRDRDSNSSTIPTISITYNDVEGGYPGTGNIDADPCFVNPDSNDFHLRETSPCINAGDPNFVIDPNNETDIDGDNRVLYGRVDMGADEFVGDCMAQTNPDYNNWAYWGKPDCWCYPRQCRGDTDNIKTGPFWINLQDLTLIRKSINLLEYQIPPGGICADFDHQKLGRFWVSGNDIVILREYISKLEANVPVCADPPDENYNFWITQ